MPHTMGLVILAVLVALSEKKNPGKRLGTDWKKTGKEKEKESKKKKKRVRKRNHNDTDDTTVPRDEYDVVGGTMPVADVR